MMGGGAQHMGLPLEPVDPDTCVREDGLNLAEVWTKKNPEGNLVTNAEQLMSLDVANVSKILGIFAASHLPYHAVKPVEVPSLANMTTQAIKLLSKNKNGFFLMVSRYVIYRALSILLLPLVDAFAFTFVHIYLLPDEAYLRVVEKIQVESGKIDLAHHRNYAKLALREVSELEEAVLTALQQVKLEETLVIVTADHSHSFTINGYPKRGNDILGFANDPNKVDVPAYETLNYANGPGFFHHRRNDSTNVNETWRPVDQDETRNEPYYMQMAAIYLKDETHGGEDVGVYAIGISSSPSRHHLSYFFHFYFNFFN